MLDLLDNDDHANSLSENFSEALPGTQHERFRARFRDLANAMSQHPLADRLANSIDRLRCIADGEPAKNH